MKPMVYILTVLILISFTGIREGFTQGVRKRNITSISKNKCKAIIYAGASSVLNDKTQSSAIRANAASILGSVKTKRSFDILIKNLDDTDEDVRQAVVSALGFLGDSRAIPYLIARLNDNSSPVRISAVVALGRLGNPRVIEPLVNCLRNDDEDIVGQSALAIANLAREKKDVEINDTLRKAAVGPLLYLLKTRKTDFIQSSVMKALGEIGDKQAIKPLLETLNGEDEFFSMHAAEALAGIGDQTVGEELKKVSVRTKDPFVKKRIEQAYKRFIK